MLRLRTCWRSTRKEPCCTTSTSLEHGTSGSQQCAVKLFGERGFGLETAFLWDGGLRPSPQETPQDPTSSLHGQHRPHHQPGEHWLALWTKGNVCEVMDSYALPMEKHEQATPLRDWIVQHWKYLVTNGKSIHAIDSKFSGDYALLYVKVKARGRTLQEFLNDFSDHDYVSNDHKAAARVKHLICNELGWRKVCQTPYHQSCC